MSRLRTKHYRINLAELQTLCGENYARLLPLFRACDVNKGLELQLDKAGSAHLYITSSSRYTTDMRLIQSHQHPQMKSIHLDIRLYHDVRLAEVTAMHPCQRTIARNEYPNRRMHQPDEKHQWNRFLTDWLSHLEQHGHPLMASWETLVSGTAS